MANRNRRGQGGGRPQQGQGPRRQAVYELIESTPRTRPDNSIDLILEVKLERGENNPVTGEMTVISVDGVTLPGLPAATDEYGLVGAIYNYSPAVTKQITVKAVSASDPNISLQKVLKLDDLGRPASTTTAEAQANSNRNIDQAQRDGLEFRIGTVQNMQKAERLTKPSELHIDDIGRGRDNDGNARATSSFRLFGQDNLDRTGTVRLFSSPQRPVWIRVSGGPLQGPNWQHSVHVDGSTPVEIINQNRRWVAIDVHVLECEIIGRDVFKIPPRRLRSARDLTRRHFWIIGIVMLLAILISGAALRMPGMLSVFGQTQRWLDDQPSTRSFDQFMRSSMPENSDEVYSWDQPSLTPTAKRHNNTRFVGWKSLLAAWSIFWFAAIFLFRGHIEDNYYRVFDNFLASGQCVVKRGDFLERVAEYVRSLKSENQTSTTVGATTSSALTASGASTVIGSTVRFLTLDAAAEFLWKVLRGRR